MSSRYFGSRGPIRPHLLRSGASRDITDLRSDVEAAFSQQQSEAAGTTANRPANPFVGQQYLDITLSKPLVWDGSMWREVELIPLAGVRIDVYLNHATGNDNNDGLASTTPVKTFARVWELLPESQTGPFVVHMDGGSHATLGTTYGWTTPPANTQLGDNAFILLCGDGAGVANHDGFYEVRTGTVTGASTTKSLTVTGGGMALDAYKDMVLEMTSGAAAGHRRHIVENTATVIYPITCFADSVGYGTTITPGNGDAFRIVRPNAVIDFNPNSLVANAGTKIHFVNVAWLNSDSLVTFDRYNPKLIGLETMIFGVEVRGAGQGMQAASTSIYAGLGGYYGEYGYFPYFPEFAQVRLPLLLAALGQPVANTSGAWHGWGLACTGATSGLFSYSPTGLGQGLRVYGTLCGVGLSVDGDASASLVGYSLCFVSALDGAKILLDSVGCDFGTARIRIDNTTVNASLIASYNGAVIAIGQYGGAGSNPIVLTNARSIPTISAFGSAYIYNYGAMQGSGLSPGSSVLAISTGSVFAHMGTLINISGGAGSKAGQIASNGLFNIGSAQFTISAPSGLEVFDGGKLVTANALTSTATGANPALSVLSGGEVVSHGGLTLSAAVNDNGVLLVTEGAKVSSVAALAVTNTSAGGANADAIRVEKGASLYALGGGSTTTSSTGASGYGVRARANARVTFSAQPTGVTGPTDDLLVDATAIADGALTALAATTGTGGSVAVAFA